MVRQTVAAFNQIDDEATVEIDTQGPLLPAFAFVPEVSVDFFF